MAYLSSAADMPSSTGQEIKPLYEVDPQRISRTTDHCQTEYSLQTWPLNLPWKFHGTTKWISVMSLLLLEACKISVRIKLYLLQPWDFISIRKSEVDGITKEHGDIAHHLSDSKMQNRVHGADSCVLWNPKAYYRVHKRPPLVPIRSQINPVHILQSCFLKLSFNIGALFYLTNIGCHFLPARW